MTRQMRSNMLSRRDEINHHLRFRRGKPFKMKCDKCGVLSEGWAMFYDEQKTRKIYCHNCYEERTRSRLKPAVCWFNEAEQMAEIVAKPPPETTNK